MTNNAPTDKILTALRQHADRSGAQLHELTGIGSGSLYPALFSLEQSGQIESRWWDEDGDIPGGAFIGSRNDPKRDWFVRHIGR